MTTTRRLAGSIKLNGASYRIATDQNGVYLYSRDSGPKVGLALTRRASAGAGNQVEFPYGDIDGYGDALMTGDRQNYHWATNLFMEHEGEAVLLPGAQYVRAMEGATYREVSRPPVGVFEIVSSAPDVIDTYVVQDCAAWKISASTGKEVQMTLSTTFGTKAVPSDTTQFNNVGYVGMGTQFDVITIISVADNGSGKAKFQTATVHNLVVGDLIRLSNSTHSTADRYNGVWIVDSVADTTHFTINALTYSAASPSVPVGASVHKIKNRYLRRFKDGAWSLDDNTYKAITAVASDGATGSRFASAGHGYAVGDHVYLVNMADITSAACPYNSMSPAGVSTLYTITAVATNTFDVADIPFTATTTGHVNRQDSDVFAEHLIIVGDLMVRAYKDIDLGWVTSRVDVVGSDPLFDANWTAGIGTVGVGDSNSPITDLVALGDGEIVMNADGAYTYKKDKGQYTNEIPELENHRHPENGRGSTEYKGWVYIPTIVGTYRYRNGQTQDITPGRGGVQDFTTPVGPIGWFTGDVSRLLAVTKPFSVHQPKHVDSAVTKIYVDYTGAGSADPGSDWNSDPQIDLKNLTTSGYVYFGSTQKWHHMFVEMDALLNACGNDVYTGLHLHTPQYWNGSNWVTRTGLRDYTRVRISSSLYPASFGQSGVLVFESEIPADWDTGGTTALGSDQGATNTMYWCRFRVSAEISTSLIIKRIIAGVHAAASAMTPTSTGKEARVDHGGMQFVLSAVDVPGRGIVWRTLWGWQSAETTTPRAPEVSETYDSGGAQPVGACAVVQPNALRAGPTGQRFLLVGLQHTNMICPLGHGADPTEDGPYQQLYGGSVRDAWLVYPDTECGLSGVVKTLQEIDFDLSSGISGVNVEVFYRVNRGAWVLADDATTLPVILTAGSEPNGLLFGLALHIYISADAKAVSLPRLLSMPVLRYQPRPAMAETIEMTLELIGDQSLPMAVDRRSPRTAYAALKALEESNASVAFVDVDEGADNVHVLQVSKQLRLNSDNRPTAAAKVTLKVVT